MASRLAISSLRTAARPRAVAALPQAIHGRTMATNPPPEKKAAEVIEKLPSSPNLITKTGTAILGAGLAATAVSQELYVMNEETVLLVSSVLLFAFIGKSMKEPYMNWARGHIDKVKGTLNDARSTHTQAVQDRIDNVKQMKEVVPMTQSLFALARETATLEAEAFDLKQKTALAAEVKTVLDSWARFEQQQKESEQAELTKSVIDKVLASLKDERTQREVLMSAISDVEQMVKNKAI